MTGLRRTCEYSLGTKIEVCWRVAYYWEPIDPHWCPNVGRTVFNGKETTMGMDVGAKGSSIATMNVVPLIDILLVLIIIFMVITPLTPKG
jgi:hypothetical protein